jgi:hypothetical protein
MKRLILIAMGVLLSAPNVLAQNFCQGDFNYNGNVAAEDVEIFLEHFGRSQFNNPCPSDGPAPVPRTGQTNAYGVTGSDGDLQKGVAWPNPRFTDNGDGTINDNLTGLIWTKRANCFSVRGWGEAIGLCNELVHGQCDLSDASSAGDWRLPNSFELASLLDRKYWEPALPNTAGTGQWALGNPFTHLQTSANYWTSTTSASDTAVAFVVNMYWGTVLIDMKIIPQSYVWPVRGGH